MAAASSYGDQTRPFPIMRIVDLRVMLASVNPQLADTGPVTKVLDEHINNAVSNCRATWTDPMLPLHGPMLLDHIHTAIAIMEKLWVTTYEHKASIRSLVDRLLSLLPDALRATA